MYITSEEALIDANYQQFSPDLRNKINAIAPAEAQVVTDMILQSMSADLIKQILESDALLQFKVEEMKQELAEACGSGDAAACDTLSREEEAKLPPPTEK